MAIKATPKDRFQIAADMSRLTGQAITKHQLDAWTADSKEGHRFPFEYAAAFEQACDTTCLQELLAAKRGSTILVGEEVLEAKLGRLSMLEEELRRQKAAIKNQMTKNRPTRQIKG